VFLNGERARTWWSGAMLNTSDPVGQSGVAGLFASVTGTGDNNEQNLDYVGDCGIQPIAFEEVTNVFVATPYAAFPVILANYSYGVAWYHKMLTVGRMQNCFGSTEAFNLTGSSISPIMTWDSKATTVLALLNGVADINAAFLQSLGLLARFDKVVDREWSLAFPTLQGEDIDFLLPPSFTVPNSEDEFTACSSVSGKPMLTYLNRNTFVYVYT